MVTNRQQYQNKVSQMISWGHWFALFNILLSLALSSRYLFVSDWPGTLIGRVYAITSWLGHFSFLIFAVYLLLIFPLTFIVVSQRLLRFLSAAIATAGLTLLLFDIVIYSQFRLHISPLVWDLIINPKEGEIAREWQLIFIAIPIIFLFQMLFSTWSWQKLRSLNRQKFGKPLAVIFITAFITSHIMYMWADANFYRPITMQRYNLPISYPMTARKFLERHGFIDTSEYERKLLLEGNPTAQSVNYPLNPIKSMESSSGYNLLIINVNELNQQEINTQMPKLAQFGENNIRFTQHYSAGISSEKALFGIFYGISSNYFDGVLNGRIPSSLLTTLSQQGYQLGLFSADGFNTPLYRQAFLSDYSLPIGGVQSDNATASQWQRWLGNTVSGKPWFSFVNLNGLDESISGPEKGNLDSVIDSMLMKLKSRNEWNNTIIIITASTSTKVQSPTTIQWVENGQFNRQQTEVPLLIHWPDTPAQQIDKMTSHLDIMATLMPRMLHVTNPASDYTQGEDLFMIERRHPWLVSGDNNNLIITYTNGNAVLNINGNYQRYDDNGEPIKQSKPDLTELLEIMTDQNRFISH